MDLPLVLDRLRNGTSRQKIAAIAEATRSHGRNLEIQRALVDLLLSREVAPRDSSFSLAMHEPVARAAASALHSLQLADDEELLQKLRRIIERGAALNWSFPQASFDQGMYIGEYGTEEVSPATLVARLNSQIAKLRPDWRGTLGPR